MAGSGSKRVIWNTKEQFISTDINRAQSFIAALRGDWLRYWANALKNVDEFGGNLIAAPADVVAAPLAADVFGGLVVIPQQGKTSVHVIPGVVGMLDPDVAPDPDDSPYKLIEDPGIDADGVLVIAANASGSIRIDVVECERVETVLEDDNRNIYNDATGLHSAALVDKVSQGRLNYRVRQGTPAAGYPGNVAGWLPLAVASVPNGSTNTDDVTFWDVRPLVSDRVHGPGKVSSTFPSEWDQLDLAVPGSNGRLAGYARGDVTVGLGGLYRCGGRIRRGTPGADEDYVDVTDATNQEIGFTLAAPGDLYYLWLLFPSGLPRWVRYIQTPVAAERFPFGCRGIPVASTVPPAATTLAPTAGIPLPAVTGLTGTTAAGRCIFVSTADSGSNPGPAIVSNGWTRVSFGITPVASNTPADVTKDEYQLVAGTHFPQNAKAVLVRLRCTVNGAPTNLFEYGTEILIQETLGGALIAQGGQGGCLTGNLQHTLIAAATILEVEKVIQRWTPWANQGTAPSNDMFFTIQWSLAGTFTTKATGHLDVVGWQI